MSSDAGPDQDRKTHGAATVLLLAVAALLPARVLADVPPLPCSDGAQAFLLAAPGGGTASWDALAPDGSAVLGRVALTRGYWLRSEDFGVFHPLSAAEAALSPRAISNGARYVAGSRVIGGALVGVRRELATGSEMLLGALSPQDISGDGRSIAGTIQVGNAVCNVVTNNDFTYAAGLWVEGGGITALPFPGSGDGGLVATASGLLYPSVYGSIGGFAVQNVVTSAVVAGSGLAVAGTVSNGVWVDIHANVGGDVCLDGSFPQSCDPFTDPCPFGDRCEPWASATCATQAGGGSDAVRWVAGAPEIQRRPSIDIFSNIRLPMGGPADVGSVGVGQAAVTSISDYGRVVTGWSLAEASAAGGGTARTKFVTRWADGGPFEHLWEGNIGYASAEGDRVVGYGQFPPGHPLAGITAFMHWDPAHGTRELHGALRDDYGVSGFSFTSPAITASLHADGGIVLAPGRIGATYGLIAVVLPCPDRDQDNLCDSWEVAQGIDLNGDGALLPTDDLLLPGADPDHRDAYVEIDVLKGWNPPAGVLTAIQRAFADVPNSKIGNPDGRSGINLHLMQDEVGITLAGGGTVYQNVVAGCQLPPDFDTLRATHFGTPQERTSADVIATKHRLFRYVVYGGTQPSGHSGIAELPGNAAIVTLGGFTTLTGYGDDWIAGTLMHELGHTFGLRHGGSDNLKYKPNYHSIMN